MKNAIRSFVVVISVAVLSIVMVLSASAASSADGYTDWNGTAAESFASGSGSASDPYVIKTAAQLKRFSTLINSGKNLTSYFKLGCDIYYNDISDFDSWNESKGPAYKWVPAGKSSSKFQGVFNGNGYTIYGLYFSSNAEAQGFIGYSKYSTVTDLTIDKSYFSGGNYTAAFVGRAEVATDVHRCTNYATVIGRGTGVGGFVGGNSNVTVRPGSDAVHTETNGCVFRVIDCVNYGKIVSKVTSTSYAGGIVGYINAGRSRAQIIGCTNYGDVQAPGTGAGGIVGGTRQILGYGHNILEECANFGTISASKYAGGIAGVGNETDFYRCNNAGAVTSTTSHAGGISGGSVGSDEFNYVNFDFCANSGNVTSPVNAGGMVGFAYSTRLSQCMNTGDISGTSEIGGIAGVLCASGDTRGCIAEYCYNAGSVSGISNVAGIAGLAQKSGNVYADISYCFNAGETSGNEILNGASDYLALYNKSTNFAEGTAASSDFSAVRTLGGSEGMKLTGFSELDGIYAAGYDHPRLASLGERHQSSDAENSIVSVSKSEIRYDREDREVGLRIIATVNKNEIYNAATLASGATTLSYGILLIPKTMLDGELTLSTEHALDVPATWMYKNDGERVEFNAVVTGIPVNSYFTELVAVAYAKLTTSYGDTYCYSDEFTLSYADTAGSMVNSGDNSQVVTEIANTVLLDCTDKVALNIGDTYTIDCSGKSLESTYFYFRTADAKIATVSKEGVVSGVSAGSTTINVMMTSASGTTSTDVDVTVAPAATGKTVIVNSCAPQDNTLHLYCNELQFIGTTITKNDGFTFSYNGNIIMIDSGNNKDTSLNYLLSLREEYMRNYGYTDAQILSTDYKLEITWALSHYHGDHYGSMLSHILPSDYIVVKTAYIPVTTGATGTRNNIVNKLVADNKDVNIVSIDFGELKTVSFASGAVTIDLMGSAHNWYKIISGGTDQENCSSMWVRVTYRGKSFLFTGDTYINSARINGVSTNAVLEMMKLYGNYNGVNYLQCDVFKSMHHGRIAYSTELADFLKPKYTILCLYYGEDYTKVASDACKYGDVLLLGDGAVCFDVTPTGELVLTQGHISYPQNDEGNPIRQYTYR